VPQWTLVIECHSGTYPKLMDLSVVPDKVEGTNLGDSVGRGWIEGEVLVHHCLAGCGSPTSRLSLTKHFAC